MSIKIDLSKKTTSQTLQIFFFVINKNKFCEKGSLDFGLKIAKTSHLII